MSNDIVKTGILLTGETIEKALNTDHRLTSQNTKRNYKRDLLTFEQWRNGRDFTKTLVSEYAAYLQQCGYAPSTINRVLASIRWLARSMENLAYDVLPNTHERDLILERVARVQSVQDIKNENSEDITGRHISMGEINALFSVCLTDVDKPTGIRDAALFAIAFTCGLRRSELCKLDMSDASITDNEAVLIIRMSKGNKTRKVYLYNGALDALKDWLKLRGDNPGFLFWAIRKGGHIVRDSKVTPNALQTMLNKRKEQAKIDNTTTWHDFRRSFAGNLLDNGNDLVTVQKLMGHSSPVTTSRYDKRKEDVKRKAQQGLFVPYTQQTL